MRHVRKQTESAEFTWHKPPRLKWRIQFFASICLFAFMGGLMLGKLVRDEPVTPQLLQVAAEGAALQLCFSRLPRAGLVDGQGAYAMLLAVEPVAEQQGWLELPDGQRARWRLEPRQDGMQLGVVGLRAVRGEWSVVSGTQCIRIAIRMQPAADD